MMCEPLRGWRHVTVTDRRTRQDYAHCIRDLVDRQYPRATKIRLVQDNLNTHDGASLYETFPPAEARRILDKIEFHYTPKHGSWLNMAETEINIMDRQCLEPTLDYQSKLDGGGSGRLGKTLETPGRHASTGPLLWPSHGRNFANFTRQSKIDGPLALTKCSELALVLCSVPTKHPHEKLRAFGARHSAANPRK